MAIPCQNCNESRATVHITDIVPPHGEKRERHLCERCAESEGITMKQHETFNTVLAKFVGQKATAVLREVANLTCPHCGITFREFRAQGQLGCPHDYQVFAEVMAPLVERAHGGATEHVGKTPHRLEPINGARGERRRLQRLLDDAVEREDYEAAAKLRDQLNALQSHGD